MPTPEAAAWTRSVSPSVRRASRKRLRYAVNHASGIAAASRKLIDAGIGISIPRGTATRSA